MLPVYDMRRSPSREAIRSEELCKGKDIAVLVKLCTGS